MYSYKGLTIKTSINEMTIGEFEQVISILNNSLHENIEKYFNLLSYLGIPDSILNEISDDDFFDIINNFNKETPITTLVPSFEHDGKKYIAYDGDIFKLKARDLVFIEKYIKNSPSQYFAKTIAVLFKPVGEENQPIEKRIDIIKSLNAAEFYPYIIHITDKLLKKTHDKITI